MLTCRRVNSGPTALAWTARLRSRQRCAWPIALALGVVFLLVSLNIIAFGASISTLTCERSGATAGNCTLVQQFPGRSTTRAIALEELRGAEVRICAGPNRCSSGRRRSSSSNTQSVVLLTTRGDIRFTDIYSRGKSAQQQVKELTTFLADGSARTLTLREDNRAFAFAQGGPFMVAGLVVATTGGVLRPRRR